MCFELLPQLGNVLTMEGIGEDDRWPPVGLGEPDDRTYLVQHRLRGRMIHLVDGDHVRDLHDPRLQGLHRVPRAGHEHEQHRVCDPGHLDLALACSDRLHEDYVLAERVQQEHGLERRLRKAPQMTSRAHRADVHARIREVVRQPDAIAEKRTPRERAGWVDRDDAHRAIESAQMLDQRGDQRGLPDSWWPGHADHDGVPGLRIELLHDRIRERVAVLDQGDRPRERAAIASTHAVGQLLEGPLLPRHDRGA